MSDGEAAKVIIGISQRFIAACDLERAYVMMQDAGVSEEQIRSLCGEYFVVNTCGFGEDE